MRAKSFHRPLAVLAMLMSADLAWCQEGEELPDDALLEFLGEWESNGEWVDPLEFEQYELAKGADPDCEISDEDCLKKGRVSDES